jgi:hypothetical protein
VVFTLPATSRFVRVNVNSPSVSVGSGCPEAPLLDEHSATPEMASEHE